MPTYEYRCPEGHTWEVFQKMSDPPVASCPQCGKDGERQLSGGAGVLFKGSGFYITDYRSEEYKKAAASEAGSGGSGGAGDGGAGKGSDAADGAKGGPAKPEDRGESGSTGGSAPSRGKGPRTGGGGEGG